MRACGYVTVTNTVFFLNDVTTPNNWIVYVSVVFSGLDFICNFFSYDVSRHSRKSSSSRGGYSDHTEAEGTNNICGRRSG